ncbi:MAG: hypothetical protein ACRCY3_00830 [Sphingorhabdus sp.]
MNRKTWGGAALILAGGFLGRETLVWAFNKILDAASSGVKDGVNFVTISWQNGVAVGLIAVGLILVLWPKPKAFAPPPKSYGHLFSGAVQIIERVRDHRAARWHERDRLEPTGDIARAGMSLLLTFEKEGFTVPRFGEGQYAENVAVGLESYFAALVQLISQGHIEEAKSFSVAASERAVQAARSLNVQEWFHPEF